MKTLTLIVLVSVVTVTTAAPPTYTVTNLGKLPGGSQVQAWDMNNAGQVVGQAMNVSNNWRAFIWQNGTMSYVNAFPGEFQSTAYAISDNGNIIGKSLVSGWTPYLRTSNGTYSMGSEYPTGVNNAGVVVGYDSVNKSAYQWDSTNGKTLIGTFGGLSSDANRINNNGDIVGSYERSLYKDTGFIIRNGQKTDLGLLQYDGTSVPNAINDMGDVAGTASVSGGGHAFVWSNGTMTDLGTLGGAGSSAAAINNFGWVVGYANDSQGRYRLFVYDTHQMYDISDVLTPSGVTFNSAIDINDSGQILVDAYYPNSEHYAFLLSPVPEPSGIAIVGLLLVGLQRRRKI